MKLIELTKIAELLSDLPEKIKTTETNLLHQAENLTLIKKELADFELKIKSEILKESATEEMKVALSNEAKRTNEFNIRCNNSTVWKDLTERIKTIGNEIKVQEIDLNYLKRQFRSAEALCFYMRG